MKAPSLWTIDHDHEQLRLKFHRGQSKAWHSERRFTWVLAGSQGGKTTYGPWWLWREIQRRGAGDYLAVTASYDLFKLKMLPVLRETFEHVLRTGRYWSGDRVMELRDPESGKFLAGRADDPMWGRIILRSAESDSGLESTTANGAWLDECGQDAFTLETWEAVQRRLALHEGRCLGTTTIYNLGWLKTEIYDRWLAGDPAHQVVQFNSIVNPAFPRAEFERLKRSMQAQRFKMFYEGEFARPPGLIYADYDESIHLLEPFEIPAHWPRRVGIDFGPVHTALIWLAHDQGRNRWLVYRESLEGGKTTHEHVQAAKQNAAKENVIGWMGGAASEDQYRRDWQHEGLNVLQPPIGEVEAGIDRVVSLFKQHRLFVFNTCKGLRDELGSYKRKLDANGQTLDEIEDKRKFHRLDALRYGVSAVQEAGKAFSIRYR
jgi:hypothetical protein